MRSDTLRQVGTVLSFLLTLAVNVAANALPINGAAGPPRQPGATTSPT